MAKRRSKAPQSVDEATIDKETVVNLYVTPFLFD
jgi:hypothetical protein